MLAKIIRFFSKSHKRIRSSFSKTYIQLKYPNVSICSNTILEKGCVIRCTHNSKITITNCTISSGTNIVADHGGTININTSFIGRNCVIVSRDNITIEKNCQIAEMVVVRDQDHNFGMPQKTIEEQGFTTAPITIKSNVWLAAKVTVTAGSTVSENTVVGAHTVVRGTLDANSVYVGVPAKKIKSF